MREQYLLTDESRKVLADNVNTISAEWDKHPSFLYQILSDAACDPFAKFRSLYAACVRAGVSVTEWDAALSAVKKRYRTATDEKECLAAKITRDAETTSKWVAAARDGVIDEREAQCLRTAIQRERESLDELEGLLAPPVDLRTWARGKVNGRVRK